MSGFSLKEGWHPKGKDGKKESWRGDFKGINQVAGWMGKGKDASDDRSEHISQPLSSLKDPSAFGPPPKHINYHGAGALPNETTPDRRGMGAPLSQDQIDYQNYQQQQAIEAEEEAAQKPAPPPVPYRVNTTGLSTNNLPPPPVRRLDSPSSGSSASSKPKGPPVPPRVPPRNDSPATSTLPPPPYSATTPSASQGYVNQEATSRLSNAGVSVPALGIEEQNGSSYTSTARSKMNDLQSRFSQMRTDSGSSSPATTPTDRFPRTSTNPDSSLPPAPSFRDRHADKIDMGKQKLGGVKSRFNTFMEDQTDSGSSSPAATPTDRFPRTSTNPDSSLPPAPSFRDRHADKIDMGKQKLGGVTSRFNTFVEDRKFSANANKRVPRPPSNYTSPSSPATPARSAVPVAPAVPAAPAAPEPSEAPDVQAQAQRKKPPPPPPKRAEIRAPAANASPVSSTPPPPPVPTNTKPR